MKDSEIRESIDALQTMIKDLGRDIKDLQHNLVIQSKEIERLKCALPIVNELNIEGD